MATRSGRTRAILTTAPAAWAQSMPRPSAAAAAPADLAVDQALAGRAVVAVEHADAGAEPVLAGDGSPSRSGWSLEDHVGGGDQLGGAGPAHRPRPGIRLPAAGRRGRRGRPPAGGRPAGPGPGGRRRGPRRTPPPGPRRRCRAAPPAGPDQRPSRRPSWLLAGPTPPRRRRCCRRPAPASRTNTVLTAPSRSAGRSRSTRAAAACLCGGQVDPGHRPRPDLVQGRGQVLGAGRAGHVGPVVQPGGAVGGLVQGRGQGVGEGPPEHGGDGHGYLELPCSNRSWTSTEPTAISRALAEAKGERAMGNPKACSASASPVQEQAAASRLWFMWPLPHP